MPAIVIVNPEQSVAWLTNVLILTWVGVRALWLNKFAFSR